MLLCSIKIKIGYEKATQLNLAIYNAFVPSIFCHSIIIMEF